MVAGPTESQWLFHPPHMQINRQSHNTVLQVTRECGFGSVVPALWVEPVSGVIPGHGWRIDWLGLWADIAEGVSVQNIQVRVGVGGVRQWGHPKLGVNKSGNRAVLGTGTAP